MIAYYLQRGKIREFLEATAPRNSSRELTTEEAQELEAITHIFGRLKILLPTEDRGALSVPRSKALLALLRMQRNSPYISPYIFSVAYHLIIKTMSSQILGFVGATSTGSVDLQFFLDVIPGAKELGQDSVFDEVQNLTLQLRSQKMRQRTLITPCPLRSWQAVDPETWAHQIYANLVMEQLDQVMEGQDRVVDNQDSINWTRYKATDSASDILKRMDKALYERVLRGNVTFIAHGPDVEVSGFLKAGIEVLEMPHWAGTVKSDWILGAFANQDVWADAAVPITVGLPVALGDNAIETSVATSINKYYFVLAELEHEKRL